MTSSNGTANRYMILIQLVESSPTERFQLIITRLQLRQYFSLCIKTLILPIFMYNAEIWFYSCTAEERQFFRRFFSKLNFNDNLDLLVSNAIKAHANHIIKDQNHVLNCFYQYSRKSFISVRCRTNRFRDSFLPFSIRCFNTHGNINCT